MTPEQRERKLAYLKEWYAKNREKQIAKARAWEKANPERAAQKKREYFPLGGVLSMSEHRCA